MQPNSNWFNEKGRYVPLAERKNRSVFDRVLTPIPYVNEFTNIASHYIHVYVTESNPDQLAKAITDQTEFRVIDREVSNHTYRFIPGNTVIRLEVSV